MIDQIRQPRHDGGERQPPSSGERDDDEVATEAAEAIRRLRGDLAAHGRAWRRYLATHADAARLGIAKLLLRLGAVCLALVVAAAFAMAASVLLLVGIAGLVAALFPQAAWLGPLAAGGVGWCGLAFAFAFGRRRLVARFRDDLERKYAAPAAAGAPPLGGSSPS